MDMNDYLPGAKPLEIRCPYCGAPVAVEVGDGGYWAWLVCSGSGCWAAWDVDGSPSQMPNGQFAGAAMYSGFDHGVPEGLE